MAALRSDVNLDVRPLDPSEYPRVAEMEFGPQDSVDWTRYAEEMNEPKWSHFGLYSGADLVGCVSLEKVGRNMAAYHVVTGRHKVNPRALAQILLDTATYIFSGDFVALVARIPAGKRAAAILALRCGMFEFGHTPTMRYFILTKKRHEQYGRRQTSSN